jgi:SAM-dependent methyltransferase
MNDWDNHLNVLNKYDPSFLKDSRKVLKAFLQAVGKEEKPPFKQLYIVAPDDNLSQLNDLPAAGAQAFGPCQLDQLPSQTRDRQSRVAILPDSERGMVKHKWELVIERVSEKLAGISNRGPKRIAVWGAGYVGRHIMGGLALPPDVTLAAVVDSDPSLEGKRVSNSAIRPVEYLNNIECDLVLILIKGHSDSIAAQKSKLPAFAFWSPFDALAADEDPTQLKIIDTLCAKGYDLSSDVYNLETFFQWNTLKDHFTASCQKEFLHLWCQELFSKIEAVSAMKPKLESSSWGTMPWYIAELYDHISVLVHHVSAFHQISKGLGKWTEILGWEKWCLNQVGTDFKGKSFLDVGFGPSLMNAVMLLLEGARRVIAVDPGSKPEMAEEWFGYAIPIFWYLFGDFAPADRKERAMQVLPEIFQAIDFSSQKIMFKPSLLQPSYCKIEDLELEHQVDIAFAYAVFEHIMNPKSALQKLYQLLIPGGYAFFYIDYGPHSDPADHHFSLYENDFRAFSSFRNKHGVPLNLHRTPHFMDLFAETGFEVIDTIPGGQVEYGRFDLKTIHPSFQKIGIEYLAEKSANFIVRKPV